MINISNFETEFKGKKFQTKVGQEYLLIGYGQSQGTPYLIGATSYDPNVQDGKVVIRTFLLRDVQYIF